MTDERIQEIIGFYQLNIEKVYAECVSNCIRDAMERKYGDAALETFRQIDQANAENIGNPKMKILSGDSLQFDLQGCTKILKFGKNVFDEEGHLIKKEGYQAVHDALKECFDPNGEIASNGHWQKLKSLLKYIGYKIDYKKYYINGDEKYYIFDKKSGTYKTDKNGEKVKIQINKMDLAIGLRNYIKHYKGEAPIEDFIEALHVLSDILLEVVKTLFPNATGENGKQYCTILQNNSTQVMNKVKSVSVPLSELVGQDRADQIDFPLLVSRKYDAAAENGKTVVYVYDRDETVKNLNSDFENGFLTKRVPAPDSQSARAAAPQEQKIVKARLSRFLGGNPDAYDVDWPQFLFDHQIDYDFEKEEDKYGSRIRIITDDFERTRAILAKAPKKQPAAHSATAAPQQPVYAAQQSEYAPQQPVNSAANVPKRSSLKPVLFSVVGTVAVIAVILVVVLLFSRNKGGDEAEIAHQPIVSDSTPYSATETRSSNVFTPPAQQPAEVSATQAPVVTSAPTKAPSMPESVAARDYGSGSTDFKGAKVSYEQTGEGKLDLRFENKGDYQIELWFVSTSDHGFTVYAEDASGNVDSCVIRDQGGVTYINAWNGQYETAVSFSGLTGRIVRVWIPAVNYKNMSPNGTFDFGNQLTIEIRADS